MYNGKMGIAIILVLLNFVVISSCVTEPGSGVTDPDSGLLITVGDGSASPGAKNVSVSVTMDNADPVRGIQMDICDDGNYLTCTGCENSMRTSDLNCQFNELSNGCTRIILVSLSGDSIDAGMGPIFSFNYDVADDAPSAECVNLTPVETKISDENKSFLDATVEQGEFCID